MRLGAWLVRGAVAGLVLGAACSSDTPTTHVPSGRPDGGAIADAGRAEVDGATDSPDGRVPMGSTGSLMMTSPKEEMLTVASAQHVTGTIVYEDRPPAGGPHNPCWAQWGVHEQPVPVENWVHNLEHGGVVLLYNCDGGCAQDIDDLEAFVTTHPRTLLTEYVDMPARFAIVAWSYRLLLNDQLDLDAYEAFYAAHFDHALESVAAQPSAQCN